jgi:hypothetical protein
MAGENEELVDELEAMQNLGNGEDEEIGTEIVEQKNEPETQLETKPETETAPAVEAKVETPATEVKTPTEAEQITALRAQIEELSTRPLTVAQPTATPTVTEDNEIDFVGDDDPVELTTDKTLLNKMLNKVYKQGAQAGQERALRAMPEVVRSNVVQQQSLYEETKKFYDENPDLAQFKGAVAVVAQEILAKEPELQLKDLFPKVEEEARKRLTLVKTAQQTTSTKAQERTAKPAFAKTGSGPRGPAKPDLSELQREIDEMNQALQ